MPRYMPPGQNDPLGDRMKQYELSSRTVLPPHTFTVVRVDGRAFHTYLKKAEKPFDPRVMDAMALAAMELCKQIGNPYFAVTHSDEISVLLCDMDPRSEAWFRGQVQKIVSVSASIATMAFNEYGSGRATFDARAFVIPNRTEVMQYFIWRQRDSLRNAVSAAAQAHFSHKSLHGLSGEQMQEKLFQEKGINFKNDYTDEERRGILVSKHATLVKVSPEHQEKHGRPPVEVRRTWTREAAPEFTLEPESPLANLVPYDGQGPKPSDYPLMFGIALGRAVLDTALEPAGALWAAEGIRAAFDCDDLFRAWMIGMNPHLDNKTPLLELISGNVGTVQAAHRAYMRGDFA